MKIYVRSDTTIKDESLNMLQNSVTDRDLYAICYGIRYPSSLAKKLKKQGVLSDRLQIDYKGLFEADSYIDYRRKVAAIVMQYGNYSESSFQFYTVYNRNSSSNLELLSVFKSAVNSGDLDSLSKICLTPEMLSYIKSLSSKIMKQLVLDIKYDTGLSDIVLESEKESPERVLKSWSRFTGGAVNFSLGRVYIKDKLTSDELADLLSNYGNWNYLGNNNDQTFYQYVEYPWLNMWITSIPTSYRTGTSISLYFCVPVKICDDASISYSIDI